MCDILYTVEVVLLYDPSFVCPYCGCSVKIFLWFKYFDFKPFMVHCTYNLTWTGLCIFVLSGDYLMQHLLRYNIHNIGEFMVKDMIIVNFTVKYIIALHHF